MTEQKANLICFPSIKEVKVYNYPLFDYLGENHFTINWKDGLNLVLGANSIGKSTFLNMVIYGIVGEFTNAEKTRVNPRFFLERLREKQIAALNQNWHIEITFSIGDVDICVTRNLRNSTVEKLTKNGIKLDKYYPSYLKEHTQINSLDDLAFVLKYLVIREEESNNLLWEKERQSKIFSILFNEVGVHGTIKDLEKKYDTQKKELKDKNEKLDYETKLLANFLGKQKKELSNIKNIPLLQQELDAYEAQKKQFKKQLSSKEIEANLQEKQYTEANTKFLALKLDIDNLRSRKQVIKTKIRTLNSALDVLLPVISPCIILIQSELQKKQKCSCCDAKISVLKSEQILKTIRKKQCPVCDSPLEKTKKEKTKEEITHEINTYKKELSSLNIKITIDKFNFLDKEKTAKELKLNKIENDIYSIRNNMAKLEFKIDSLKTEMSDLLKNGKLTISKYDEIIEQQEQNKNILDKAIKKQEKEIHEFGKKISAKSKQLNEEIIEMAIEMNKQFSKYAKDYFKKDASLIGKFINSTQKKPYFIPKFETSSRNSKNGVSSSERVLLEYIFRLVILEMYYKKSGKKIFFMLETSEGVFDHNNTLQLAKMFSKFGDNSFPIILILNNGKDYFIKALKINEYKEFDLRKYGRKQIPLD